MNGECKRRMQASGQLAQFTTCFYQDAPCARMQAVTLDARHGTTYVLFVRGSHGEAGPVMINMDCAGTSGGLPSWLASGALLPPGICEMTFVTLALSCR
jgi:hypothetical protein